MNRHEESLHEALYTVEELVRKFQELPPTQRRMLARAVRQDMARFSLGIKTGGGQCSAR